MSTELDQEKIDENVPAVLKEDQGKIDEDVPAVLKDQGKIDEDGPAVLKEDQGKIDEDVPAVLKEDQGKIDEDVPDVLKEDQGKIDEDVPAVLKEDQGKIDEDVPDVLKEDQGKIDEDVPAVLKEDQGKIDEDVPAVLKDQGKIDEDVPALLKEDQGKIDEDVPDILLKESELKQEGSDSTSVIIISDAEDEIDLTCPTPKTVPMAVPINGLCLNNLNKLDSEVVEEMRCSSEPVASLSIIDLPQPRRYESVPKDTRKCPVIIDYIVIQDSDTECENALEQKPKRPLKRKRSLIPTNIEVENTRKTMKPGPKSKTRNIVTVHQMITEAKMRGKDVTLDFSDTSEDEIDLDSEDGSSEEASNEDEEEELLQIDLDDYEDSENSNETDDENEMDEDEEEELPTIKIIGDCITITSSDDEADNLEPEVGELIVGNEASTSSDNFAMEILLSLSNEVTINKKSSETLDKSDETDVLENVIDSNKMVNDNKALENNAIEQNKIEDKNVKSHEIKNGE